MIKFILVFSLFFGVAHAENWSAGFETGNGALVPIVSCMDGENRSNADLMTAYRRGDWDRISYSELLEFWLEKNRLGVDAIPVQHGYAYGTFFLADAVDHADVLMSSVSFLTDFGE